MKVFLSLLIIGVAFLIPSKSWAWGMTGHRVVVQVASQHLTDVARKNIHKILGPQPIARWGSWMDDIRSNPNYDTLKYWHYVSIPDGLTFKESNLSPHFDLIRGIHTSINQLKSGKLNPKEEAFYLKILMHLIGDLHQPLHVGRAKDLGGNTIHLSWFGDRTNLHKIWDTEIIKGKQYSYTELATIIDNPTPSQIQQWQAGTIENWAEECIQLRPGIYEYDTSIHYWEYHYMYRNWPIIKSQLEKAGIRLAKILNKIFG